ncbi:MAG: sulfur carrier protein ThiS [Pseudomonadota bacterium]
MSADAAIALTVTVNGAARAFDGPLSVSDMLQRLGLEPRKVAVERNRAVVPRSLHRETALEDGDAIEIVQFVGGG